MRHCQKNKKQARQVLQIGIQKRFGDDLLLFRHYTSHGVKFNCSPLKLSRCSGQKCRLDDNNYLIAMLCQSSFHGHPAAVGVVELMATAVRDLGSGRKAPPGRIPGSGNSRSRIVAAAADVLQNEPDNFSVQRVARQAGISARAVYGYFESGAELARTARLSTLHDIVAKLPCRISDEAQPVRALQLFAHEIADALRPHGSVWLLSSRQDEMFRSEYRHMVRRPLVGQVEAFIRGRGDQRRPADYSDARLAELLVTTIESVVVNCDPEIQAGVDCNELLDEIVHAICHAYAI